MKLPIILFILLVCFNLLSLYLIIGLFSWNGAEETAIDTHGSGHPRFMAYLLYITVLLNLYSLFYIAVRKRFDD